MIVYLYLTLVARSCNCGGVRNFALLSTSDLGDLRGKIAYSDYLYKTSEKLILDIQTFPIEQLKKAVQVDYNHPTLVFLDSSNAVIFSTQLHIYPTIRNGRYDCSHK